MIRAFALTFAVLLTSFLPAPAAAYADAPPSDHSFQIESAVCDESFPGWFLNASEGCHVNATGVIRFGGCINAQCSFRVTGAAAADGLRAGLPKLRLWIDTIVLDSSGSGGTTYFPMCSDADALRALRCSGATQWETLIRGSDCLHLRINADYRNTPTGIALFADDPGIVEGAAAIATYLLCRSEDGVVTFGPWAPPPPRPPGRVELEVEVPSGKAAAIRLNLSGATDLRFEYGLDPKEESWTGERPPFAAVMGAHNGDPWAFLSFSYWGDSSGIEPDPTASVNVAGERLSLTLPPETFGGGGTGGYSGTYFFKNWQPVPEQVVVIPLVIGSDAVAHVRLDWSYGEFSYDVALVNAFGLTKEDFDSGAHATVSTLVAPGATAGALLRHERAIQHDAIAVWSGDHDFETTGTTSASCTEAGAPCPDTWNGVSVLAAHGPEDWAFEIDLDARNENERYVLYGVELPDTSYFYALH